jgi:hypothetical protein
MGTDKLVMVSSGRKRKMSIVFKGLGGRDEVGWVKDKCVISLITLRISAESEDFILEMAARTMVSSEAGSSGGVGLTGLGGGGPVGVVEVGRGEGGGGD